MALTLVNIYNALQEKQLDTANLSATGNNSLPAKLKDLIDKNKAGMDDKELLDLILNSDDGKDAVADYIKKFKNYQNNRSDEQSSKNLEASQAKLSEKIKKAQESLATQERLLDIEHALSNITDDSLLAQKIAAEADFKSRLASHIANKTPNTQADLTEKVLQEIESNPREFSRNRDWDTDTGIDAAIDRIQAKVLADREASNQSNRQNILGVSDKEVKQYSSMLAKGIPKDTTNPFQQRILEDQDFREKVAKAIANTANSTEKFKPEAASQELIKFVQTPDFDLDQNASLNDIRSKLSEKENTFSLKGTKINPRYDDRGTTIANAQRLENMTGAEKEKFRTAMISGKVNDVKARFDRIKNSSDEEAQKQLIEYLKHEVSARSGNYNQTIKQFDKLSTDDALDKIRDEMSTSPKAPKKGDKITDNKGNTVFEYKAATTKNNKDEEVDKPGTEKFRITDPSISSQSIKQAVKSKPMNRWKKVKLSSNGNQRQTIAMAEAFIENGQDVTFISDKKNILSKAADIAMSPLDALANPKTTLGKRFKLGCANPGTIFMAIPMVIAAEGYSKLKDFSHHSRLAKLEKVAGARKAAFNNNTEKNAPAEWYKSLGEKGTSGSKSDRAAQSYAVKLMRPADRKNLIAKLSDDLPKLPKPLGENPTEAEKNKYNEAIKARNEGKSQLRAASLDILKYGGNDELSACLQEAMKDKSAAEKADLIIGIDKLSGEPTGLTIAAGKAIKDLPDNERDEVVKEIKDQIESSGNFSEGKVDTILKGIMSSLDKAGVKDPDQTSEASLTADTASESETPSPST